MRVSTTERHSDGPVETSACPRDVQGLLLTEWDAPTVKRDDLLSFSLAGSLAILKAFSGTAAFFYLLTLIQDPAFDTNLFNIKVKSILSCQNIFGCIVRNHKQSCGSNFISGSH